VRTALAITGGHSAKRGGPLARGVLCAVAVQLAACSDPGGIDPAAGGTAGHATAVADGGTPGTGGAPAGTGGAAATAGTGGGTAAASGGATASGGANATGGTKGSGGAPATGGATATGGSAAAGASGGRGGSAVGGAGRSGSGGSGGSGGGTTGGAAGGARGLAGMGGTAMDAPPGYVPAIIGVGYGGLRIVSRDAGKTWGDRVYAAANGADDANLLRAVVYGKGLWVATGSRFLTSTDGLQWQDRGSVATALGSACTIAEGLAYKDGYFYAACFGWENLALVFRSVDGSAWTRYATIGDTTGHLFLTYRGQKFVAYGDNGISYQSSDALSWTVLTGVTKATYCLSAFMSNTACLASAWFDGVWLRADWQGKIARSTDGTTFTQVYSDDAMNTLYQSRALAAGYVAPR
jgi:hypothetical protein